MSLIHLHAEPKSSAVTPRVSWRTLILMVELLVAVIAWRYLALAEPVQASSMWLVADGHTASSIQGRMADDSAATTARAVADQNAPQP